MARPMAMKAGRVLAVPLTGTPQAPLLLPTWSWLLGLPHQRRMSEQRPAEWGQWPWTTMWNVLGHHFQRPLNGDLG